MTENTTPPPRQELTMPDALIEAAAAAFVRAVRANNIDAVAADSGLTEKPRDDAAHSIDTDGRCAECGIAEAERPLLPKTSEHPDIKRTTLSLPSKIIDMLAGETLTLEDAYRITEAVHARAFPAPPKPFRPVGPTIDEREKLFTDHEKPLGSDEAFRTYAAEMLITADTEDYGIARRAFYAGSNAAHALRDAQAAQVAKETEEGAAQMDAEDYHAMIPEALSGPVAQILIAEMPTDSDVVAAIGDRFVHVLDKMLRMSKPQTIADLTPRPVRRMVRDALQEHINAADVEEGYVPPVPRIRSVFMGDSFGGGLTLRFGPDVKPETIADSIPEQHQLDVVKALIPELGYLAYADAYALCSAVADVVNSEDARERMVVGFDDAGVVKLGEVFVTQSQYAAVRDDLVKQLGGQAR